MTLNDVMSIPDTYLWEPLQRRWPVLYRLDDREWKTWVWHGLITVGVGHLLGLIPHVGPVVGMWVVVVVYFVRELSARVEVTFGTYYYVRVLSFHLKRYKWRDGFWDVAVPAVFTLAETLWRH